MKALQKFSPEYLELCKKMKPEEIVEFLENFRLLQAGNIETGKSILISIKVPENLLESFRLKAKLSGTKYQTQIKKLMKDWLTG